MSHVGWRSWLPRWRRNERGISEAATAIFVLPIIGTMIFLMIETGFNMRYRQMVDNVVQDTVRGVAYDGANAAALNSISTDWDDDGRNRLYQLCGATYPTVGPRCKQAPTMACTPQTLDHKAFVDAVCTATFYYKRISPIATNPVFSLGFDNGTTGLFSSPVIITVKSKTAVGNQG